MMGRTETLDTAAAMRRSLEGRRFNPAGIAFEATLLLLLLASLLILVTLLADIVIGAVPVFRERGLDFITSGISLDPATAGVWTALLGSIGITVIVATVAFPLGIGTAIYLEEYAPNNTLTRFLQTNIRNLAGVPSIVYGLLGLAVFVRLVDAIGLGGPDTTAGRNVIAAGITLAVLVLPVIIITASEALRAVPDTIREAGFGVGATQWEVIRHHTLPIATPGILTGTVLALARAFGETAPLLVIGVATGFFSAGSAGLIDRLTGTYTALPAVVLSWSRQTDPVFKENLAPAAILVLLVVLFVANGSSVILRNRYERRW